ncbi:translocation/assembly module TamB domain-containing protein [Erythrobacter sp.]|jgi:translocation and assembly module TamB|uniref:translocation/assembly module TamB domain-containing protein n=1 Tax=Erythrobacter sp. TaxID=1042 RepID=UPI002EB5EEAD|nr:translocation/assembly module TamB domain-containing protein [Erythrobacter sp.]
MADTSITDPAPDEDIDTTEAQDQADAEPRKRKRRWAKRLGWTLVALLTPILLAAAFLSSPIGKRFVADQIAQVSPASGLRFEVGRIEGDIYSSAVLHDVVLKDPQGTFLTVPEVVLEWRPLAWLWSGLDIRELTARRGRLERLPELLPGDPDAPTLPNFDIRVDRFAIEDLTLAPGVAGERAQRVNFAGEVDIRSGRVFVDAAGTLGSQDRVALLLDAEPDGDLFDLELDVQAAETGPIAALAGLDAAYRARIAGEGTWTRWLGHALVTRRRDEERVRVAGFRLTNDAGTYGLLGTFSPPPGDGSILDRALGEQVALALNGSLEESVFDGELAAVTPALDLRGEGVADLAGNALDGFEVSAYLRDPDLLGESLRLRNARVTATIDGPFRDLAIDHRLQVAALETGVVTVQGLIQAGTASYDGETWRLPIDVAAERVVTGNDFVDPRLTNGRMDGLLTLQGDRLEADNTRIAFPGLDAQLTLRGDLAQGRYALAGPVEARGIAIPDVGNVSASSRLRASFGGGTPWQVNADLSGVVSDVRNATIVNFAGERVRFDGSLAMGGESPIVLRDVDLSSERLTLALDSRIVGDTTTLEGSGRHVEYGPFTFDAELSGEGPRAQLVLADPLPAAGLTDVRVGIAPSADGFAIDVAGGSLLGPFAGDLGLVLPAEGPTGIAIERLAVDRTNVTGGLTLGDAGISGNLRLAGGGLDGTIALAPGSGDAQNFDVDIQARGARFGGDTQIALGYADIDAEGSFGGGSSRIIADIEGTGLEYGALNIAAFNAKAEIVDGRGDLQASIAGRRADRFQLKLDGDFTPERIALIAQGEYGGRAITMPRRAVLTSLEGGGYRLAPTQIGFANGFTVLEGTFAGEATAIEAKLARMPLRLADLAGADLGLGGRLSGIISYSQSPGALPRGNARVRIDDFTRSGLVLSSRPIDVYAVADLSPSALSLGARLREDERRLGRLDARITRLPQAGGLADRIMRGRLDATLAFEGPAQSLWRLAAIEVFDLTGPLVVSARATGTLADPRITGELSSDDLRLQSAVSGTDITDVTARGRFAGSRLELTRFAGRTQGGGTVSGSGSVDLSGMSANRGPQIDIRAAANDARLLNANGLHATITGPLRIVSNGNGGAIAGRVEVERASWALGVAEEDLRLPTIPTREVGLADGRQTQAAEGGGSWRYLVDARAPSRISVDGMGLESEWGIDIALRGTVDDPRIGGEARLVRGDYTFAGTRFELTEGRIEFDANQPIDPRLDIEAETSANGTDVRIDITGNAQSPEIAFSSTPALPEEEILARLLFGGSVTSLSATDAVQLAAALASLRGGGGGLDPIGDLRRSIGLDQLRIVSADPALGRGTGVALGKNLGRRFYIELITDGQGYSATQLEYQITSWLALLGTVTTIGRDSALVEIRRDY